MLNKRITCKIKNHKFYLLSVMLVAFLLVIVTPANSNALTKGLTISPLRSELNIAPGTSLEKNIKITNSTDVPMVINLGVEEFNVINQRYDYVFTKDSDVTKWIYFDDDIINLSAGESRDVSFTIGVPLSAEPGGRYISMFAGTNVKNNGGMVNSVQRVASLLYLTVVGDVTRSGELVSLSSPWLIDNKTKWSAVLKNTGSTHFHSRYNISIKNIFNNKTIANLSGDSLILPNTLRSISNQMPAITFPGIYRAVFMIGLGDSPAFLQTRYVIYSPSIFFYIIIVSIFFVISLYIIKKIKRHKKAS